MKVILDIEDEILTEMQLHSDIIQEELNIMLSNLFVKTVLEPIEIIRQEQHKDNCAELESFHALVYRFLTQLAHDPNNFAFNQLILRFRDEHISYTHTLIDLFKTYKSCNKINNPLVK